MAGPTMRRMVLVLLAAAWPCAGARGATTPPAAELRAAGVQAGFAVHLPSGRPERTAALAAHGQLVVQALAPDEAFTEQARAAIAAQRLAGLASVETRPHLDRLPYTARLLNLVVVDNLPAAEARQLAWPELLRILVPGGVVLLGGTTAETVKERLAAHKLEAQVEACAAAGEWVRVAKRRAWGDQWTHNRFRTAGNARVSTDPINPATQALWFQWLDGDTNTWWGSHAAMCGLIAGEGCMVSLADNEVGAVIREGQYWRSLGRMSWILSCRDAYNGTVLWTRPWSGWHQPKKKQTLAMDAARIYTVEAGRFTATGLRDGVIAYVVEEPHDFHDQSWPHCEGDTIALHDPAKDGVWVFEAATGKLRWAVAAGVTGVAVAGGRLFAATGSSKPGADDARELRACDLVSGKELWRKRGGDFGAQDAVLGIGVAQRDGPVLVSVGKTHTVVLKAETGEMLHKVAVGGEPAFTSGDHLFFCTGEAYNLKTNTATGLLGGGQAWHHFGMGLWACAPGAYTERMFLEALALDPRRAATGPDPVRDHPFLGTITPHITCITGCAVAHGLVFQPEQGCGCAYSLGRTRGGFALTPVDPLPPAEAFQAPGPREDGPGLHGPPAPPPAPGDWPIFRRDAARSCAGDGALPDKLDILWRRPLAHRPDAAVVRNSWRAQHNHNQTLSAPVVAGGKVFVALVDEHQVAALKASDGGEVWRFTANARIDSPPTIQHNLCLFGCRDGWVYCLNTGDGKLAWRRRSAPVEERFAAYGQFEARYPVIGSVLVEGDRGYATAGHSCQLHVMLWEFEPASGKTLAYRPLPRGQFTNGILVREEDGGIYLDEKVVAAPKGAAAPPPPSNPKRFGPLVRRPTVPDRLFPQDQGLLSTANTAALKPRGQLYLRQIPADRWTWRGDALLGFSRGGRLTSPWPGLAGATISPASVFRVDATKLEAPDSVALVWQTPVGDAWALALADGVVVAAGPVPERYKVPELTPENIPAAPQALPVGRPPEALFARDVLASLARPWWPHQQDPLVAPGFLKVLDAAQGKPVTELALPATPVQDGIAVCGGRIYLALADGSLLCLGAPGQ